MTVSIVLPKYSRPAIVDDDDLPMLSKFRWSAVFKRGHKPYAIAYDQPIDIYMHRLILSAPHGLQVDHINGDGLDNRRLNLRLATLAENLRNCQKPKGVSGFRGVEKVTRNKLFPWIARINGKHIGYFRPAESAARAYDFAAMHHFGEFANTNYPRRST